MRAGNNFIDSASLTQRAISRYELENNLRAWYLRTCQERLDYDKQRYLERRREAHRWFKALCDTRHFQNILTAFSTEQKPLGQAISLVSWLDEAQDMVHEQFIPYEKDGRLSTLDKLDTTGGLQVLLSPELDSRVPKGVRARLATIAGLLDFLGVPSTGKEVAAALRRYAQASVRPAKPEGAIAITRLLHSWEAPNGEE